MEDSYKITEFTTVEDNAYFDKDKYLEVDKVSYEDLKKLSLENTLYYPKDGTKFDISKVILDKEDPLQLYKYASKMKATDSFKKNFNTLDYFVFLKYFCLSMELSDKGFFMHLNNVETILEGVKEKEPKLLEKAEELAFTIKSIETKMESYDDYKNTIKGITASSTEDKVDDFVVNFLK